MAAEPPGYNRANFSRAQLIVFEDYQGRLLLFHRGIHKGDPLEGAIHWQGVLSLKQENK
jgi:hypothetical protein